MTKSGAFVKVFHFEYYLYFIVMGVGGWVKVLMHIKKTLYIPLAPSPKGSVSGDHPHRWGRTTRAA